MADGLTSTPREITREAYLEMIAAAGFDVHDLVSLEFRTDGIYAEVFAHDPQTGEKMIDHGPGGEPMLARHRVYVKVVD